MNIVLTTGHSTCDFASLDPLLRTAGVAAGLPSRREQLSPLALQSAVLEAHGHAVAGAAPTRQVVPGRIWQDLAADLVLANLSQRAWGWSDARLLWLLEFWLGVDTQSRVLLFYASPSSAIVRAMGTIGEDAAAVDTGALLEIWRATSEEILRLATRFPDRCLLVNETCAAEQPAQVVAAIADWLQIEAAVPSVAQTAPTRLPDLDMLLAASVVAQDEDALVLFHELESCADLTHEPADSLVGQSDRAWTQVVDMRRELILLREANRESHRELGLARCELSELQALADQSRQALDSTARSRDDQRALAARQAQRAHRLEAELRRVTTQRDELLHASSGYAEALSALRITDQQLRPSIEALLLELHSAHLESEALFERTQAAPARAEAALVRESPVPSEPSLAREDSEDVEKLRRDRDRAKLQVLQLNAELVLARSSERSMARDAEAWQTAAARARDTWRQVQAREAAVDMRREIVGSNWHYAESDGRWSGPSTSSTLALPALTPGAYRLEMLVQDALSMHIVDGAKLFLNEVELNVSIQRKKFPRLLSAPVAASGWDDRMDWQLRIELPEVLSPASRGSADQRRLGIRVREVKLISVSGDANQ